MPSFILKPARSIYLQAIEYYAAINPELGERFDAEVQHLVDEVSRDPQRFFRFHPPAQRALARKFPYSGKG